MSKITLNNVASLDTLTAATTINNNSSTIQTAFDNTLSRDGTSPNTMLSSLDMNSYPVLNLPLPVNPSDVVRLQDVSNLSLGMVVGRVIIGTKNINGNVTGDTAIAIPSNIKQWRIGTIFVQGVTGTFTTIASGLYTGPSQTGSVLNNSALSGITTTSLNTVGNGTQISGAGSTVFNLSTVYFNVGTPQGGTCTFNYYLEVIPLP